MKRRQRHGAKYVAALAAVVLLMTACGGDDDSGDDAAGSGGGGSEGGSCGTVENPRTVAVGIDIPFHPLFDYIQAKKDELFADTPYRLDVRVLDATTQVPTFGRGELDIMTTVPSFMPRVTDQFGDELQYIFPLARWTPGPEILVPADSDVSGIEDLQGKTVAIPPLDTRFGAEQAAVLAATDEKIEDYFELNETEAAAQELELGRVDAAFIEAPSTYELLDSGNFKSIYNVQDAFEEAFDDPAVMNGGYIAREEFVEECPGFIDEFIRINEDVWEQYQEDPDEVNQVASEVSGIPVEQLETVGQVLNLSDMPADGRKVTARDVETWNQLFPVLAEAGFITEAPDDVDSLFIVTQ